MLDASQIRSEDLQELIAEAQRAMAANAQFAREDPLEFNAFVLRDEETGEPVDNTHTHAMMHACIDESDRTVIVAHIECGKSNAITIGRTLWQLGHNHNLRGAIVSNTEKQASKFLRSIKHYIQHSRELRHTFPDLLPGPTWQETQIIVRRTIASKDPSIQAIGIHGALLGARLDWVVADDLLDHENTRTKAQRDDVFDWFHATVMGRLTRDAKVIVLGTAWHKKDLLQRLGRRKVWFFKSFPVGKRDAKGRVLSSTWPQRWPVSRIVSQQEELGPLEADRQLWTKPLDDGDDRFKTEYLVKCLRQGAGIRLCSSLEDVRALPRISTKDFERLPQERNDDGRFGGASKLFDPSYEVPVLHGVDLAGKRTKRSAHTVIFSIALHPNGRRQLLRIRAGKFDGPTIVEELITTNKLFGGIFMVENNSTQSWILEFTSQEEPVPMVPFTTGKNKADPLFGVESLAAEFNNAGWIIPCTLDRHGDPDDYDAYRVDDEVEVWLSQLREYEPTEHTGDYVMASWFARELARRLAKRAKKRGVGARVVGGRRQQYDDEDEGS